MGTRPQEPGSFERRPPHSRYPGSYSNDPVKINHRIKAREVRVIAADGQQLGVLDVRKAIEIARSQGLDLVEVSPTATPPVCKILDYGKYKYEQKKKKQAAKKKQVITTLKEIQFRPNIDKHDVEYKVRHIQRFLEEGHKVKASLRFRGREAAHSQLGYELLKQVIDMVGDLGIVEDGPKMEGKLLYLIFAPQTKGKKAASPKPTPPVGSKPVSSPPATAVKPGGPSGDVK